MKFTTPHIIIPIIICKPDLVMEFSREHTWPIIVALLSGQGSGSYVVMS